MPATDCHVLLLRLGRLLGSSNREGGFGVNTCVRYSFDRMLSITAFGWHHPVLRQPPYRRGEVVARFRNDFT
eukprot:2669026-Prymnesium_polylepis.1